MRTAKSEQIAAALDAVFLGCAGAKEAALLRASVNHDEPLYLLTAHRMAEKFLHELDVLAKHRPLLALAEQIAQAADAAGLGCCADFQQSVRLRVVVPSIADADEEAMQQALAGVLQPFGLVPVELAGSLWPARWRITVDDYSFMDVHLEELRDDCDF